MELQITFITFLFLSGSVVHAQSPLYGQCGGSGWTGSTTCVSGSCCTYSNDYYSQCLPGSCGGGSVTTTAAATTTRLTTSTSATSSAVATGVYKNPIIWEDLADLDIFRW
ncbi:fungal cellulose binding domain-containing protein [Rutstroemia sp. NJR-2017a BBW]|nr:fungal cellulose binding domain-containing protein [Rutstroemia sp. NJR-2017a BBW]